MTPAVLPSRLAPQTFIGPAETVVVGRGKFAHRDNLTISGLDEVHEGNVVESDTAAETALFRNPREFIHKYTSMIEDHVERRAAIAMQQFVVAYCTHLHFEIGGTRHQAESAKALHIVDHEGQKGRLCVRNAAHSSTLPCLIAYDGHGWAQYVNGGAPAPQGFVYVEGSTTYNRANSTLDLPRKINEADIAIDGNNNLGLRRNTLAFMNSVAAGAMDPTEALRRFLDDAIVMSRAHAGITTDEAIRTSLEIYDRAFTDIRARLVQDPTLIDHLLGVKVDADNDSAFVRATVYRLRYKAIQDSQLAESSIVEKVNALSRSVLVAMGLTKKPVYFDEAVRMILTEQIGSREDGRCLSRLFNSPQMSSLRPVPGRVTRLDNVKAQVRTQMPLIHQAATTLRMDFRTLRRDEILKRGKVLRVLREDVKHWSQRRLAAEIRALYPITPGSRYTSLYTPASQTTISNAENNIKIVDVGYATQLAKVLKVDPALFIPSFFY